MLFHTLKIIVLIILCSSTSVLADPPDLDDDPRYPGSHSALSPSGKGVKLNTSSYSEIRSGSACYRMISKRGELFVPNKNSGELSAFLAWAAVNPSKVSVVGCSASCGDAYCENSAGETAANCPIDCAGSCGDGICHASEDLTNCAADCKSCGDGTCTAPYEDEANCAVDCTNLNSVNLSTPYLFVNQHNQYFIENDVLYTYVAKDHEQARFYYESSLASNNMRTDLYKLRLNPTVQEDGLRLQLKEIELEESFFDQIALMHVIYPQKSILTIDHGLNAPIALVEKAVDGIKTCRTSTGEDCTAKISRSDDQHIDANKGDFIILHADLSGTDKSKLYLVIYAWMHNSPGLQTRPFEAHADEGEGEGDPTDMSDFRDLFDSKKSLHIELFNAKDSSKKAVLPDIHPRYINARNTVFLGDALTELGVDHVDIKITWTEHHLLDHVGLSEASVVNITTEDLKLVKATHSSGNDVLKDLLNTDKSYAQTVRGERIDLVFAKPSLKPKDNEQEGYIFISNGFYHGLRSYNHPNIDVNAPWKQEIQSYVDELNKYISTQQK